MGVSDSSAVRLRKLHQRRNRQQLNLSRTQNEIKKRIKKALALKLRLAAPLLAVQWQRLSTSELDQRCQLVFQFLAQHCTPIEHGDPNTQQTFTNLGKEQEPPIPKQTFIQNKKLEQQIRLGNTCLKNKLHLYSFEDLSSAVTYVDRI